MSEGVSSTATGSLNHTPNVDSKGDVLAYNNFAKIFTTDVKILDALFTVNFVNDFDLLARSLMKCAVALNTGLSALNGLLLKEFERCSSSTKTILRANTLASKAMDLYVGDTSISFVKNLLMQPLFDIIGNSNLNMEIDPRKIDCSNEEQKEAIINQNRAQLEDYVQLFIDKITSNETISEMPYDLRHIASIIADFSVAFNFEEAPLIASFIILRVYNPLIVCPEKAYNLPADQVSNVARRNLVLISKVIQNLANGVLFGSKESFMTSMNPIIEKNKQKMNEYLAALSPSQQLRSEQKAEHQLALQTAINNNVISSTCLEHAINLHKVAKKYEEAIYIKLLEGYPTTDAALNFQKLLETLPEVETQLESSEKPSGENKNQIESSSNLSSGEMHYAATLKKAMEEDLSDIARLNVLTFPGRDKQGRHVILFQESCLPSSKVNLDRVLLYMVKTMDQLVQEDYVIVYAVNNSKHSTPRPQFSWMRDAYRLTFTRKYKKNLKDLYIVHPTFWMRVVFNLFRPFVSGKFWKKLHYVNQIPELYQHIDQAKIILAPDVFDYDLQNRQEQAYKPVFGKSLQHIMAQSKEGAKIPEVVEKCLCYIDKYAVTMEGIFRIPGSVTDIQKLKMLFDHGCNVNLECCADPHVVAGLLKLFLRELQDPLLTFELHDQFLEIIKDSYNHQNAAATASRIATLVASLPRENYNLLESLMQLLVKITQFQHSNRMSAQNLATVIGNALIRIDSDNPLLLAQNSVHYNNLADVMISNFEVVFPRSKSDSKRKQHLSTDDNALSQE